MRRYGIITVLILTIFIWTINSCIVGVSDNVVEQNFIIPNSQDAYDKINSTTSLYGITTLENANWYVFKFHAESEINVDELCVRFNYRSENYDGVDCWGHILTDFNMTHEDYVTGVFLNESERFFHFEFGSFNYTYDNQGTLYKNHGRRSRWYNLSIPGGVWYLICYAGPSVTSEMEVYINITGNAEFLSSSEGSNAHVFTPEDFLGNINLKIGCRFFGVINGEKLIHINNTLFCIQQTYSGWGYEKLCYTSPSGIVNNFRRIFWKNKEIRIPNTLASFIDEESGVWRFELDCIQWGGIFDEKYFRPSYGISFFVADIDLP